MGETAATHALFGDTDRVSGIPDLASWFDWPPSHADVLGDVLSSFIGDYLVDAFGVWDCDGCGWVRDAPVVVRFEEADLVVAQGRACAGDDVFVPGSAFAVLSAWRGSVDNEAPVVPRDSRAPERALPGDRPCLQWARIRGCSPIVGDRLVGFEAPGGRRDSSRPADPAAGGAAIRLLFDDGDALELRLP